MNPTVISQTEKAQFWREGIGLSFFRLTRRPIS